MPIQLCCPICHESLATTPSGVCCPGSHQFDRARQGYLNLLPSHKKKSKQPGDDNDMVAARARFLSKGHYQPVVNKLVELIHHVGGHVDGERIRILDAGCGEGFYTTEIQQKVSGSDVCGVDISKPAILSACRRSKDIEWLVASVSQLPLMGNQFDVIISVFSRTDWQEFARLLKPGGHVLMVTPGQHHLLALRQLIYQDVRPYPEDKRVQDLPENLSLVNSEEVKERMMLEGAETIMDLLTMTPHYWHVKPEQKEALEQLTSLECELEMRVSVLQKR
ncbi:putative RNA methyltransferase [uncultured Endozoicomonas sp.]|uniref:putative RNA methyltransferase n=1 Tax=uncultured Endozoicomonas sp. TaxID=432652 RepID=UPI0026238EE9|nr:methyltransferase domain-containing protein [uncultured Endozoicomonas sp.]